MNKQTETIHPTAKDRGLSGKRGVIWTKGSKIGITQLWQKLHEIFFIVCKAMEAFRLNGVDALQDSIIRRHKVERILLVTVKGPILFILRTKDTYMTFCR